MDVREKLVELLKRTDREVYEALKDREDYREEMLCDYFASNLIANGVTVQENCKACAEATQNCIVKLQEQIAELRSVQEWISVKDRLPDNRDDVLLCRKWWNEIRNPQMGWYNDVSQSWFDLSNREIHNVTHWMPLPQPPKGE